MSVIEFKLPELPAMNPVLAAMVVQLNRLDKMLAEEERPALDVPSLREARQRLLGEIIARAEGRIGDQRAEVVTALTRSFLDAIDAAEQGGRR
jgi:hypothetical protein